MLIYDVLKKDHDEVKGLINELLLITEEDKIRRHDLIHQIRDALIPHSRAEEAVFYNSLRTIDSAKDIVMHGYSEHLEAETLLRTLQLKDKIDAEWTLTASKLKEALNHHINDEETKIFSLAKSLISDEEAEEMAEAFQQLKPEVQNEGFLKTTIDMVTNLMPTRFKKSIKLKASESRPF